jgi:hypothetical protein
LQDLDRPDVSKLSTRSRTGSPGVAELQTVLRLTRAGRPSRIRANRVDFCFRIA